jgi:hypothetical protein
MTDVASLVEILGKEHFDPKLQRSDVRCVNGRFPSYFRSLRNFSEGLAGANQARAVASPGQAMIHFPSTTAHVAIV